MDYALLARQLEELAREDGWYVPLLANASALIYQSMADLNWAGFYLMREEELVLGVGDNKLHLEWDKIAKAQRTLRF